MVNFLMDEVISLFFQASQFDQRKS